MIETVLTEEARVAVLRALLTLVLDDEAPASARVAAARLFLDYYERIGKEQSTIVIVDDETATQNAV